MATLDEVLLSGVEGSGSNGSNQGVFTKGLFKSVVECTRISNRLPCDPLDFEYRVRSSPQLELLADEVGGQIASVLGRLLTHVGEEGSLDSIIGSHGNCDTENVDCVTDVLDVLLENVDSSLDEYRGGGSSKQIALVEGQLKRQPADTKHDQMVKDSGTIPRPQLMFKDKVDNSRTPFVPKIAVKPNALVPLNLEPVAAEPSLPASIQGHVRSLGVDLDEYEESKYPHPYETEVRQLVYTSEQLSRGEVIPYASLEDTPLTWVDTPDALLAMVAVLEAEREIAVDLEHHSYRSFQGFLCLLQISTRHEDFLVDTLALRAELGPALNRVFTHPEIVKVFHGADSDVLWLQRDFGVYIVNLFDTGQAARVLEYGGLSLAFLLQQHCQLTVDKQYQLSDWRQRPLSAPLLKYAREDTHYLLFVYDRLRAELLDRSAAGDDDCLREALDRSKTVCLQRYEKERFTAQTHQHLMRRFRLQLRPAAERALAALADWRDSTARREDESPAFVIPNHVLIKLAQALPATTEQLYRCCRPLPPLVRAHTQALLQLVATAKAGGGGEGSGKSKSKKGTRLLGVGAAAAQLFKATPSPVATEPAAAAARSAAADAKSKRVRASRSSSSGTGVSAGDPSFNRILGLSLPAQEEPPSPPSTSSVQCGGGGGRVSAGLGWECVGEEGEDGGGPADSGGSEGVALAAHIHAELGRKEKALALAGWLPAEGELVTETEHAQQCAKKSQEAAAAAAARASAEAAAEVAGRSAGADAGAPKSIASRFNLSNSHRNRNKRLKDEAEKADAPDLGDGAGDTKRQRSLGGDDTASFLQSIGCPGGDEGAKRGKGGGDKLRTSAKVSAYNYAKPSGNAKLAASAAAAAIRGMEVSEGNDVKPSRGNPIFNPYLAPPDKKARRGAREDTGKTGSGQSSSSAAKTSGGRSRSATYGKPAGGRGRGGGTQWPARR